MKYKRITKTGPTSPYLKHKFPKINKINLKKSLLAYRSEKSRSMKLLKQQTKPQRKDSLEVFRSTRQEQIKNDFLHPYEKKKCNENILPAFTRFFHNKSRDGLNNKYDERFQEDII